MPFPVRLMYVEDHSDTRDLVSFVLREEGFEVVLRQSVLASTFWITGWKVCRE
jgi:CheY-like chemotaxis protein